LKAKKALKAKRSFRNFTELLKAQKAFKAQEASIKQTFILTQHRVFFLKRHENLI
jgi:hypothetical protein